MKCLLGASLKYRRTSACWYDAVIQALNNQMPGHTQWLRTRLNRAGQNIRTESKSWETLRFEFSSKKEAALVIDFVQGRRAFVQCRTLHTPDLLLARNKSP